MQPWFLEATCRKLNIEMVEKFTFKEVGHTLDYYNSYGLLQHNYP